jgi:hypothetical protein
MTQKKYVLEALRKISVPDNFITTSGDTITIDRNYHRGYRSASFTRAGEGPYTMSTDSSDRRKLNQKVGGKNFTKTVEQWYNAAIVEDSLRAQGFFPSVAEEKDGSLRVYAQA